MKRLLFALLLLPSLACAQAFRVGTGIQIVPKASRPSTAAANGTVWIDSTAANVLKYTNPAGSSITLGAGGGGSTLAASYSGGASQTDSTITLDSTRLGLRIRNQSGNPASSLLAIQDNSGATTYLDVTKTTLTLGLNIVSGCSECQDVGSSGTLMSNVYTRGLYAWGSGALNVGGNTAINLQIGGASTEVVINSTDTKPNSDLGNSLGTAANRWGALFVGNDGVGTTVGTAAATLSNNTAATVGTQKYSPALIWSGRGWQTTGPASETVQVAAQLVPIQGTTHPTQALTFYESINGGAWAQTEINGAGYFGSNDQAALGSATTTSTTFVDVGNGSSTGFTSWTAPTTKVTKTYRMTVVVRAYMPTIAASSTTYFQVLQDGAAISGQPTATASQTYGTTTQWIQTTWRIAVPQTAGTAHVYKLQWKVGNAADTAGVTASVGTLQFFIEG